MVDEEQAILHGISLDHTALAELPELPGLSSVTLCNDESGTEPDFKPNKEHDSELLSSSLVPAAPHLTTG